LTPEEGGVIRSFHLAKGLVQSGIEVEVITAHNQNFYDLKIMEGIKVHYLPVKYEQQFGFGKRIWSFWNFVQKAKKLLSKLPRPDYLYLTSTPLTVGLIGLWAKKKLALPFIFEVRDLWPEAPIQIGVIRNPILKMFLYKLETEIYKDALKIVALSPGIADYIRKKSPLSPVSVIPNFSDLEFFQPDSKEPEILKKYGLQDAFTITYTGAIGKVNAVEEIMELARIAQEKGRNYQFVFMGKGSRQPSLIEKAKHMGLSNFHCFPFGNKEKVREILSISDMACISFDHLPILKTNSPNKFFDALAAGKAILVNHKGWVYDLVTTYRLGLYFNPKKPLETFELLDQIAQNPESISRFQRNSRKLAEQHFSKEMAVQRLLAVLDPQNFGRDFRDEVYILTA
jgi:glycosyltransferase involved in cell wall biosynthesis